jgi:hypothetical protein
VTIILIAVWAVACWPVIVIAPLTIAGLFYAWPMVRDWTP